jgi:hypothetical protein
MIVPYAMAFPTSFHWFAIPSTSTDKRSWEENSFNKENINTGDPYLVFPDIQTLDILVGGNITSYSFYITSSLQNMPTITIFNTAI